MIPTDFVVTLPFVLSVATVAYTWWATRNKGVTEQFQKGSDRMARSEGRVEQLERDMLHLSDRLDHLPNKEMTHDLALSMARMEGQINTLAARLEPVSAIAERMQELMIEQGRK